jgi:homoserine O-succinyltransferase
VAVRLRHNMAEKVRNSPEAQWTCALVNNMPDGAFDATERQFLGLLDAGSGDQVIDVQRFAMGGIPRGERTAARIGTDYSPLGDMYPNPPDLLLLTGSNPVERDIRDEQYWDDLVELLTWSRRYVPTTVLSCLSAHAALTVFDGIERVRLPTKCTGVFPQVVEVSHPLGRGIDRDILLPHSRQNSVPRDAIIDAGYDIVIHSEEVGWSVASREENGRQLVLVQGHPEYDRSSLLREYHRDVGRYVHHERDDLPILPFHCAAPPDWSMLESSHRAIIDGQRDPALVDHYPFDEVGERAPWPWRVTARRFYANVLANMSAS